VVVVVGYPGVTDAGNGGPWEWRPLGIVDRNRINKGCFIENFAQRGPTPTNPSWRSANYVVYVCKHVSAKCLSRRWLCSGEHWQQRVQLI